MLCRRESNREFHKKQEAGALGVKPCIHVLCSPNAGSVIPVFYIALELLVDYVEFSWNSLVAEMKFWSEPQKEIKSLSVNL